MEFEKISGDVKFENNILKVPAQVLQELAEQSFTQMRYFFRTEHLEKWRQIYNANKSSEAEKEKMWCNLKGAVQAKKDKVPFCQDTGTDNVYLFRGNKVVFENNVEEALQQGAIKARQNNPFRNSVFIPDGNGEKNSNNNSPAEINFFSHNKEHELRGVFSNKGGGSGSKLWNFSCTPALNQDLPRLKKFIAQKITEIGHSACPPYEMRIVLGGLSHLQNSSLLTRATVDDFSFLEDDRMQVSEDSDIMDWLTQKLKNSNMGAQGDGNFFTMPEGIRIFRAPRHAAHFFVGIGVACSAHRVQNFKINKDGVWLEKLETNPEKFLPDNNFLEEKNLPVINLNDEDVLDKLREIPAGKGFLISGKILGARDKAHARWLKNWEEKKVIPEYLKKYSAVCYVGPSDTPDCEIIGSFGPTTATRMDKFAAFLLPNKLIPLSVAKGSRTPDFAKNCQQFGGMFAAIQGGPASFLRKFVRSVEVIDFEDLGMEAVRLYEVENLPAQMVVDATGKDFYAELAEGFLDGLNA